MSETRKRYRAEIEAAIEGTRESGSRALVGAADGAGIYAYPLREGRIAWGVNAPDTGWNILRAVRETSGTDTGLSDSREALAERVYLASLRGLSDAALEREAAGKCWLSSYAASWAEHPAHWQWEACEAECTRRGKPAIAERAWDAATGPKARRAPPLTVRESETGLPLPVQVLKSAAGFYLGAFGSDGSPYTRESVEYWKTEAAAAAALANGHWSARRHANPPPAEFARDAGAAIYQARRRSR